MFHARFWRPTADFSLMPGPSQAPDVRAYRPDIDGLRAVAVLSVIFYHLGSGWFSGGYVGVDVFFVISGYLVCGWLLQRESLTRSILLDFYARRARRILPAFLAMLLGSTLFFYLTSAPLLDPDMIRAARAALFYIANFFLMRSDYFGLDPAQQPFLHLWSLGVEEQFYIFVPLFLIAAAWFFKNKRLAALWGLAFFSLALCLGYVLTGRMSEAFYLPQTRVWEFLAGAFLASGLAPRPGPRTAGAWGGVGLLFIIAPVLGYQEHLSWPFAFPGLSALPPVLGTCFCIHAGLSASPSGPTRLLSHPALVFTGLISYSLYLWHYPVIVAQRFWGYTSHPLILLGIMYALAILSWVLVEKPTRRLKWPAPKILSASLAAMLISLAALTPVLQGVKTRSKEYAALKEAAMESFQYHLCHLGSLAEIESPDLSRCVAPAPGKNYLLIGDSHAAHLYGGLNSEIDGMTFHQFTFSSCLPLLDHPLDELGDADKQEGCARARERWFQELVPSRQYQGVILAGKWFFPPNSESTLDQTLEYVKQYGLEVIVIGPQITYSMPLSKVLRTGDNEATVRRYRILPVEMDQVLRTKAEQHGARYISPIDALCANGGCAYETAAGVPLTYDFSHLTSEGSKFFADRIKPRLTPKPEPPTALDSPEAKK